VALSTKKKNIIHKHTKKFSPLEFDFFRVQLKFSWPLVLSSEI